MISLSLISHIITSLPLDIIYRDFLPHIDAITPLIIAISYITLASHRY